MIVKYISDDDEQCCLTLGHDYYVFGIEADLLRIVNDEGEPVLYDPEMFSVVDNTIPSDWIVTKDTDVEGSSTYAYPAPLNSAGFFEDFFEELAGAQAIFWRHVQQLLIAAQKH